MFASKYTSSCVPPPPPPTHSHSPRTYQYIQTFPLLLHLWVMTKLLKYSFSSIRCVCYSSNTRSARLWARHSRISRTHPTCGGKWCVVDGVRWAKCFWERWICRSIFVPRQSGDLRACARAKGYIYYFTRSDCACACILAALFVSMYIFTPHAARSTRHAHVRRARRPSANTQDASLCKYTF